MFHFSFDNFHLTLKKPSIIATIIISLLANDAVGQKKYERPAVKAPDTFRGADASAPADQTSIGDLKWFEVFKDEELQKLVRTAMIRNYDLRAAVAHINAARANLGLAGPRKHGVNRRRHKESRCQYGLPLNLPGHQCAGRRQQHHNRYEQPQLFPEDHRARRRYADNQQAEPQCHRLPVAGERNSQANCSSYD